MKAVHPFSKATEPFLRSVPGLRRAVGTTCFVRLLSSKWRGLEKREEARRRVTAFPLYVTGDQGPHGGSDRENRNKRAVVGHGAGHHPGTGRKRTRR